MTAQELLGWLALASPFVAGASAALAVVLVKKYAPAREVAIAGADYVEAIKEAVGFAERYGAANGVRGFSKLAVAVKEMDKFLDDNGIHGDAKRITMDRVMADIELMRVRLFPKKTA